VAKNGYTGRLNAAHIVLGAKGAWGHSDDGGSVLVVLCPALELFKEAVIIGRLLTGYTAIEYQLCMCAGMGAMP
jgi:hypothetical protein